MIPAAEYLQTSITSPPRQRLRLSRPPRPRASALLGCLACLALQPAALLGLVGPLWGAHTSTPWALRELLPLEAGASWEWRLRRNRSCWPKGVGSLRPCLADCLLCLLLRPWTPTFRWDIAPGSNICSSPPMHLSSMSVALYRSHFKSQHGYGLDCQPSKNGYGPHHYPFYRRDISRFFHGFGAPPITRESNTAQSDHTVALGLLTWQTS